MAPVLGRTAFRKTTRGCAQERVFRCYDGPGDAVLYRYELDDVLAWWTHYTDREY